MSTHESKASSTSKSSPAKGVHGTVRERRRYWWLGRIEGAPLLRHLSLWQKLLMIVVVLLLPTVLLLRDFVGKSNEEIVRIRREMCVESYAQQLKRILRQQIAMNSRAFFPGPRPHHRSIRGVARHGSSNLDRRTFESEVAFGHSGRLGARAAMGCRPVALQS